MPLAPLDPIGFSDLARGLLAVGLLLLSLGSLLIVSYGLRR